MPRTKRCSMILSAAILAGVAGIPAFAQAPASPAPAPAPAIPEFKWPDFATVTKDMTSVSGLFTLYRHNPTDATKDHTRLLAVIPRSLLKQDLLLATSISKGELAGFMWDDYLVRFEQLGKTIVIAVPDSRFVTTPGQPVSDAVLRTYPARFLASMPIVTMSPGGDPVVDLGPVLTGPTIALPFGGGLGGMFGMPVMPRRDLSEFTKVKAFPENVLIDVNLALAQRNGMGADNIGVSFAFRKLPDINSYKPRLADERVGYFTTVRQDWNLKHSERENIVRYANRWDLRKKDPSLELSPPEKPIVFVIEKTVPLQWRRFVKEGIEDWNKAFEKIGIVGAIVAQQQTDDNEFANVDPEDARYNFFRWVVTGSPFAMGPSRADPRTGQLLDADIIFDDSMVRMYNLEFDVLGPKPVSAFMGPDFGRFLMDNPEFLPLGQKPDAPRIGGATNATARELLHDMATNQPATARGDSRPSRFGAQAACNYADGLKHQMAMMNLAVAATGQGKKVPERLIGEMIREVVAHEIGHTLGLRHNFKASSWLTLEEVKRRRDTTDEPTVSSVMDYNPIIYFSGDEPEKLRHLITPCIGPYDMWAIEHGYKIASPADGDEKTMLAKIASQSTKRENAYLTDEDTMGLSSTDPLSNRFDMGDDPVAWANQRTALVDSLMKDLKKWAVKGDEPNHYLKETFMTLLFEKTVNNMYVSRVVGGQYYHRNRPGDPDAKPAFVLVPAEQQRKAIESLSSTILSDAYFTMDAELLNEMAPSRWWDWNSMPMGRTDFPVHQLISNFQAYALMNLVSPRALERVYDAELKSKAADKFTAAELINTVKTSIWSGLDLKDDAKHTDGKPMLSSIRRNLQRQHLQYLLAIADSEPGQLVSADVQSMVRFALRDLSNQINATLARADQPGVPSKVDFATRAHLTESRAQIERVLTAPHIKLPRMMSYSPYYREGAAPAPQPAPQE